MKIKRNKRVEMKRRASSRAYISRHMPHADKGNLLALRMSIVGYVNRHRKRPAFVDALLEQDAAAQAERLRHLEAALGIPVVTEQYALVTEESAPGPAPLPSLEDGRTNYESVMASQRIRRRII